MRAKVFLFTLLTLFVFGVALAQEPYNIGLRPFYVPKGAGWDGAFSYKPSTAKPIITSGGLNKFMRRSLGVALGYVTGCEALFFRYFDANNLIDNLCTELLSCRGLVDIGEKTGRGGMEFIKKHCKAIDNQITRAKRKAGSLKKSFGVCFTAGWELPEINKCQH